MGPIGNYWHVPRDLPVVKWQGGELLAWRVWRLCRWHSDGGLRLVSLARDTVWHGPVLTADHVPDAVAHSGSGVYALKPATRPSRRHFDWALGRDTWVRGWVALSGRVVEHEHGYRAERVVIRGLRQGRGPPLGRRGRARARLSRGGRRDPAAASGGSRPPLLPGA